MIIHIYRCNHCGYRITLKEPDVEDYSTSEESQREYEKDILTFNAKREIAVADFSKTHSHDKSHAGEVNNV
jgi:hypothetical protein